MPPTKLTVHPYLVYQHTGVLAAKEVGLLVELAQEPNHFVVDLAADHYAEHLMSTPSPRWNCSNTMPRRSRV